MLQLVDDDFVSHKAQRKQAIMALKIDQIEVFIPQSEVVTFESIRDLNVVDRLRNSLGYISLSDQKVPVYCFTEDFGFLEHSSQARNICVVLAHKDSYLAILCDEIRALDYADISYHMIPDCMAVHNSPLSSLCIYRLQESTPQMGMIAKAESIEQYVYNR